MGGGGGSDSRSLGDTRSLEQRAREILEGSQRRKNIFISFAFEDIGEVNLLRGQAKNDNCELQFNDRSVREEIDSVRAEYIKQRLSERINQCSTTIVYLSADASRSPWVTWEVEKSLELGKRVVATHKGDSPPALLPEVITKNGIQIVPWSDLSANLSKF